MKNSVKKMVASLFLVLPLIGGIIGLGMDKAYAAEDTVSITLNKKAVDTYPEEIQNTGETMNQFEQYDSIQGVDFTGYNVSTEFWQAYNTALDGKTAPSEAEQTTALKAAQQTLLTTYAASYPNSDQSIGIKTTDAKGQATFDVDRKNGKTFQAYLFFETKAPANVTKKATPMLVVLPVNKADGTENTAIQLYPKNEVKKDFTKEMVGHEGVDSETNTYTHNVGDRIEYYIDFTVPHGIGDTYQDNGVKTVYQSFELKDAMDKVGTTFVGVDKIVPATDLETNIMDELSPHYTLTSDTDTKKPSSFTLAFNLSGNADDAVSQATTKALANYAGQQLRIYYSVVINENAVPDQPMQNTATETINRKGSVTTETDQAPKLAVGGKQFEKYDGADGSALAGAEFVVKVAKDIKDEKGTVVANAGQYIQFTTEAQGKGSALVTYDEQSAKGMTYVTDPKEATIFTSDDNGQFSVQGLMYADENAYAMIETKAPEGYAVVNAETPFTINEGSFGTSTDSLAVKIANTKKGFLPSTGGKGIYAYLAIGAIVLVGAGFWFVRSRKNEAHV